MTRESRDAEVAYLDAELVVRGHLHRIPPYLAVVREHLADLVVPLAPRLALQPDHPRARPRRQDQVGQLQRRAAEARHVGVVAVALRVVPAYCRRLAVELRP